MIGKILHGSAFGGLVKYVNDPRKMATLVAASDGVNLSNSQAITDSFVMQAGLSYRTKKPVAHIILAFSPEDVEPLEDRNLERIVHDYLKRMGYDDNQFVAFRHFDKKHPHVHIIVNRVNFQGRCTSDSHEKDRNIKVCKDMTNEYGLYKPFRKNSVNEKRLHSMDAIRYQMMHCIMESFQSATNWKQFQDDLALVGIRCRFRYNKKSNGIEGISFSIAKDRVGTKMRHDVSFSGKQLDPSLTLDRLCQKLGNPLAIVHEQARDHLSSRSWPTSLTMSLMLVMVPSMLDLQHWQRFSSNHTNQPYRQVVAVARHQSVVGATMTNTKRKNAIRVLAAQGADTNHYQKNTFLWQRTNY